MCSSPAKGRREVKKASVAIVLLNWNGWRDTLECLESVYLLDHDSFAVIVVDNASTDGSAEHILGWPGPRRPDGAANEMPPTKWQIRSENDSPGKPEPLQFGERIFIQAAHNGGFASGNNLGIRYALAAGCDYVWLLNNDTVVDPSALSALIRRTRSSQHIGMCGSVLRFYDQPEKIQAIGGVKFNFWLARGEQLGQGLNADDPAVREIAKSEPDYIAGASMLVTKDLLEDVGLMEEGYFLYFEEIDWAMRARPRWELAIAGDSVVYHKEGGSIGTSSRNRRSVLSQYYLTRNLLRFYAIRRPGMLLIAFARTVQGAILQVAHGDWELARTTIKATKAGLVGESGKSTWVR